MRHHTDGAGAKSQRGEGVTTAGLDLNKKQTDRQTLLACLLDGQAFCGAIKSRLEAEFGGFSVWPGLVGQK